VHKESGGNNKTEKIGDKKVTWSPTRGERNLGGEGRTEGPAVAKVRNPRRGQEKGKTVTGRGRCRQGPKGKNSKKKKPERREAQEREKV